MSRRVGVFGGTFDPPHRGHRSAAADVADALGLDEVVWIPAGDPPHKHSEVTPAPSRLRMVRAITAGDERFRVSELEVAREGPSYTVDTLRALRESEPPGTDLFLIMGVDQYRAFESWREPDAIRSMATLAVMDRRGESVDDTAVGDAADGPGGGRGREGVVRVPVGRVDVSSTRVRAAADRGDSIAEMVPAEVLRIIDAEGLYRRGPR